MKFKVTVIEVSLSIREVEAKDYEELKQKIDEDGQYVGSSVKQHFVESMIAEVADDCGKTYQTVKII